MATIEQLEEGIRRADAAGDTDSVAVLGKELLRVRGQPTQSVNAMEDMPQPANSAGASGPLKRGYTFGGITTKTMVDRRNDPALTNRALFTGDTMTPESIADARQQRLSQRAPIDRQGISGLETYGVQPGEGPIATTSQRVGASTPWQFVRGMADTGLAGMQLAANAAPLLGAPQGVADYANRLMSDRAQAERTAAERVAHDKIATMLADPDFQKAAKIDPAWAQDEINKQLPGGFNPLRLVGNLVAPEAAALKAAPLVNSAIDVVKSPLARGALRTLSGGASGATAGALQPIDVSNGRGDYADQLKKNMLIGGGLGATTSLLGQAASRVLNPRTNPNVMTLLNQDITPTPGQILGGGFKSTEEKLASRPILGMAIRSGQERATGELNTAAINRALEPIGQKLPANMSGREAIAHTQDALGDAYDSVLNKIGNVPVDRQLSQDFGQIITDRLQNMKPETTDQFNRIIQNEIGARVQNGELSGQAIKAAESNLRSLSNGFRGSRDFDQLQLARALNDARTSLRDMLTRQSPQNAEELQKINQGYANFKIVQKAAGSLSADEGTFTPSQLQSAVKASNKSRDKGDFSRKDALMQDLSEPAKAVLSSRVPNSGTVDRLLFANMLRDPLRSIPGAAVSALSSLAYTPIGQEGLATLLARRQPWMRSLGDIIREHSATTLPVAAGTQADEVQ